MSFFWKIKSGSQVLLTTLVVIFLLTNHPPHPRPQHTGSITLHLKHPPPGIHSCNTQCTCAPTHARPGLPVNPNPYPIPAVQYGMELQDTAAIIFLVCILMSKLEEGESRLISFLPYNDLLEATNDKLSHLFVTFLVEISKKTKILTIFIFRGKKYFKNKYRSRTI